MGNIIHRTIKTNIFSLYYLLASLKFCLYLSMTILRRNLAPKGADKWSCFLRQRQLKDRLRRLRNDFKSCYCPPACRGGLQSVVVADAASPPPQDLHGPYVSINGGMPRKSGRPLIRKHGHCTVLAEARGTSDILLHRDKTSATLRMSLQVHTDPDQRGRFGYYGEMFLMKSGGQERFIGFIHSWRVDRTTKEWETLYLNTDRLDDTDFGYMRDFIREIYGCKNTDDYDRDQNGSVLPEALVRRHFGAPWAGLHGNTDLIFIPMIWLHENVCTTITTMQLYKHPPLPPFLILIYHINTGVLINLDFQVSGNRIIDQGFELFYRLMIGGTLPARKLHTRLELQRHISKYQYK